MLIAALTPERGSRITRRCFLILRGPVPAEKMIRASMALIALLMWPATMSSQGVNSLTAREKVQGWQLLFDGKTTTGWHSSAPVQGTGRSGAPQPAQPGAAAQIGSSPKPCATARTGSATAVPAGGSHWEVADGALIPCGAPAGYLTAQPS